MMYQNILVINLLHIGDLLLATPVLRALRAEFPQAHITLLADAKIDAVVKYNRHIDELISVDKKGYHNKLGNYLRLIADIRGRKFDLVVNLHPNERASAIAAFSGAKKIVGYSSRGFGLLFDLVVTNQNFDRNLKNSPDISHQVEQHLALLEKALGICRHDHQGLDMWLDDATLQRADALWATAFGQEQLAVIGFNTGASWPTKRWTTAGFAAVADKLLDLGYGVAFFGGPMDTDNVEEIVNQMEHPNHPHIAVFTGRVSLLELAGLIRKCTALLTNDSGPMHVAIAQKTPVIAIFGPSNEVGFGPYDKQAITLTAATVTCRPCGQHSCDHLSCMTQIEPDIVLSQVLRLAKSG